MSIKVISKLKPKNDGYFPVVDDTDVAGGFQITATLTTRNAIPDLNRKEGMWVKVLADSTVYELSGGITNSNWVAVSFGGGSSTLAGDATGMSSATKVVGIQNYPIEIGSLQYGSALQIGVTRAVSIAYDSDGYIFIGELSTDELWSTQQYYIIKVSLADPNTPVYLSKSALIPDNGSAWRLLVASGSVWALDDNNEVVLRYNKTTLALEAVIPLTGQGPADFTYDSVNNKIWVGDWNNAPAEINRIDVATNAIDLTINTVPDLCESIIYANGYIWAGCDDLNVYQLDASSGAIINTIDTTMITGWIGGSGYDSVNNRVWFTDMALDLCWIDASTGVLGDMFAITTTGSGSYDDGTILSGISGNMEFDVNGKLYIVGEGATANYLATIILITSPYVTKTSQNKSFISSGAPYGQIIYVPAAIPLGAMYMPANHYDDRVVSVADYTFSYGTNISNFIGKFNVGYLQTIQGYKIINSPGSLPTGLYYLSYTSSSNTVDWGLLTGGGGGATGATGPAGATGATGPAGATGSAGGAIEVADFAALAAIPDASLSSGTLAYVLTYKDFFILDHVSAKSTDTDTTSATNSGTGRWLRQNIPHTFWQTKTSWYIDSVNGNDGYNGQTEFPLKTHAELVRRVGYTYIPTSNITINIVSATIDSIDVPYMPYDTYVQYVGTKTSVNTGTVNSVTARSGTTNQPLIVNHATAAYWATYANAPYLVTMTSGTSLGGSFWVQENLNPTTPGSGRMTPCCISDISPFPNLTESNSIAGSDTFAVYTLTTVPSIKLSATKSSVTSASSYYFKNLRVTSAMDIHGRASFIECYFDSTTTMHKESGSDNGAYNNIINCAMPNNNTFISEGPTSINAGKMYFIYAHGYLELNTGVYFGRLTSNSGSIVRINDAWAYGWSSYAVDIYPTSNVRASLLWGVSATGGSYGVYVRSAGVLTFSDSSTLKIDGAAAYDFAFGATPTTSCRAFDDSAGTYATSRTLTWANLAAAIGSGGFADYIVDPVSGASVVKV